jgi:hypothetical protein
VYRLAVGLRIEHQNVDGLIAKSYLKLCDELQCLALPILDRLIGPDQQIEVPATRGVIQARSKHGNHGIGSKDFRGGLSDDPLLFGGKTHALLWIYGVLENSSARISVPMPSCAEAIL